MDLALAARFQPALVAPPVHMNLISTARALPLSSCVTFDSIKVNDMDSDRCCH